MVRPASSDAGVWTRGRGFLGGDDAAQLARLCNAPIARIERNRGGSTLSFRVWLTGGQRALFKPQQRAEVANYRAELAAYRLGRLLDLHRTPPACGRLVPRETLQRAADASGDTAFSQRVMTELLGRAEAVPGAMLLWVPGSLEPVPGVERYAQLLDITRTLPPSDVSLAAELSALLLFDFLEDNVDRWSGGNILRPRAAAGEAPGADALHGQRSVVQRHQRRPRREAQRPGRPPRPRAALLPVAAARAPRAHGAVPPRGHGRRPAGALPLRSADPGGAHPPRSHRRARRRGGRRAPSVRRLRLPVALRKSRSALRSE
ncbi:MAG: hypothetical protein IPF99_43255 [Deltaproteobacteria bacterium]|nr:hypothetical protein [Deltaproteobacteria bacterium]